MATKKGRSKDIVEEDADENEEVEDEMAAQNESMEDQFEAALAVRGNDTWRSGGAQKDIVIRVLIQCFGSMIGSSVRSGALPDHRAKYRPQDMVYKKLIDASKQVVKAKKMLLKNENFDTRDFTVFIARKQWVSNILRPLLELCDKEDSGLAMNCAGLALVLVRRMSDKTLQVLADHKGKKRAKKVQATSSEPSEPTSLPEGADAADNEKNKSIALSDSEAEDERSVDQQRLNNARDQLSALLSFKEALCSSKCNEAITNAFRDFWAAEQVQTTEDSKLGVAICLSYFRRILAISPDPTFSSPGEIIQHRDIHHQYIVQLRMLLSVVPGICSDLRRSYHDDWLADVIHIIYFVLQSYEADDMFLVWKSQGIIAEFATLINSEEVEAEDESAAPKSSAIAVPAALQQKYSQKTLTKGLLSSTLAAESNKRAAVMSKLSAHNRFNRFSATYKQPLFNNPTPPPVSSNDDLFDEMNGLPPVFDNSTSNTVNVGGVAAAAELIKALPADAIFLRDVFGQASDNIPQAKTKRNRRNITFVQGNPYMSSAHAQGMSQFAQQATVIAASFMEVFSQEAIFKMFVRRVNEDLRRDERRISHDLELEYFHIICKVLQYNRRKLEHSQEQILRNPEQTWQPSFKNIIDTLDKMSFTRVAVTIEKLFLTPNKAANSYYTMMMNRFGNTASFIAPVKLFTEMIAYLRLMLFSNNMTYYEISIGALYRLYYITAANKLDMLAKLLSNYKNNTHTKEYLHSLITCAHETVKTLEAAQNLFVQSNGQQTNNLIYEKYRHLIDSLDSNKKSKALSKKELDMELYIMSCFRFSVSDYLKKLMSANTVTLYAKVMQGMETNSPAINHYVFRYIQRCYDFKIESDSITSSPVGVAELQGQGSGVNMSFVFYNLSILHLIHSVLDNVNIINNPKYAQTVALLKRIVRDFALLSRKNRLLFVEALLNNLTNMDMCSNIYSIYDAHLTTSDGSPQKPSSRNTVRRRKDDSDDDELGDEFDDSNLPTAFTHNPKAVKASKAAKTSKKRKADSDDDDLGMIRGKDSDGSDQANSDEDDQPKQVKQKVKRHRWSAGEDEMLTKLYDLYASSRSIYSSIAEHDDFIAFGGNRSSQQIAKRIRSLGLHDRPMRTAEVTDTGVRAAWEGEDDGEQGVDVFEQRSLALQKLSEKMLLSDDEEDKPMEQEEEETLRLEAPEPVLKAKKRTLQKKGGRRPVELHSDSEDSTMDLEEAPQAHANAPVAKSLSKMFESDDED